LFFLKGSGFVSGICVQLTASQKERDAALLDRYIFSIVLCLPTLVEIWHCRTNAVCLHVYVCKDGSRCSVHGWLLVWYG